MPSKELKRNFVKGKQNRDFDPRLIPPGEYISLLNGRVARSEGSNVGAVENVLGNQALSTFIDTAAIVVGSIRDQEDDRIFYFVSGAREDGIYEYSEIADSTRIIARSSKSGVLKFNVDNLITGINLIGEGDEKLLFWTDGLNPPRRINIERFIDRHQGRLDGVVPATDTTDRIAGFTEEEMSVVKMPPLFAPNINTIEEDDLNPTNDTEEDTLREQNFNDKFIRFAYRWKYADDEYSVFSPFSNVSFSVGRFSFDSVTGQISSMENLVREVEISFNTGPRDVTEIELLYKSSGSPTVYVVENYRKSDPALNWADNVDLSSAPDVNEQVVTFSSNKLFRALPDRELARVFDNVPLTAKTQEIAENVLIYGNYTDRYDITDVLKTFVLDDDGNRVLGTNADGSDAIVNSPITIDINAQVAEDSLRIGSEDSVGDLIGELGEKNLKSDRDYELGVVYLDNVGRSTPVLTSADNSFHIPIQRANRRNRIQVSINHKAPDFATHYRLYVKDVKNTSYNIIPLDSFTQPDDNEFKWFRIAATDAEKIEVGDYLNLKINENTFSYLDNTIQKQSFRIEELGPQERNFLELETPRVGKLSDDTTGEVFDEGEVITVQKPGLWMKIRNSNLLGLDIDSTQSSSVTGARSNNARGVDGNRPIQGNISDYQDTTYYYSGSNIVNDDVDELAVTFSGVYTPGIAPSPIAPNTASTQYGPTGTEGFAGPMRVEVEILSGNMYQWAWFISPSSEEPTVIRQVYNLDGEAIPSNDTARTLLNGVSVAFNLDPGDYNVGDKFTCIWRRSGNFMWRAYNTDPDSRNGGNPNSINRTDFNARRAHVMMPGPDTIDVDGINGRSLMQFGVTDGLNRRNEGTPITVPFRSNEYYTDNVYYDNLEEWMFESGMYATGIQGTDRDGDGFGIHQMGFWRGFPISPGTTITWEEVAALTFGGFLALGPIGLVIGALISIFGGRKNSNSHYRILSDTPENIMNFNNTGDPAPLYGFVQSGVYNESENKKKADIRMGAEFAFVQGTGASRSELSSIPIAFETVPTEDFDSPFFEIGDTFKCENGIHYGNDPSDTQLVDTILPTAAGTETSTVTKPAVITLDYFNCFAWSNGIESMAFRDQVGQNELDTGVKASVVVDNYERESNFADLIFSRPYNDSTGVNGLNDFSISDAATGAIIKRLDQADGTIQHLHAENRQLLTFQQDKISAVQVSRNVLFNADGSTNVTASNRFLNETVPFIGEYGISDNPESFAVYGGDKYFSDRNRGVVLTINASNQLSEISEFGMRDFFRDNLASNPVVIGSYDDYHDQYIVTMREEFIDPSIAQSNIPLLLSRQGFLSRSDACRFPESKLQFTEVYEFWQENEPLGFQVGDIIYNNLDRTSIFNGDNDWFVWTSDEEHNVTALSGTVANGALFSYNVPSTGEAVSVGQVVTLQRNANTLRYPAVITEAIDSIGGLTPRFRVRFTGAGATLPTDAMIANGMAFDLEITFKFVINIDDFGMVRRKLDCVGISPLNHDAFRASLEGYSSAQEACGNGVVSRILYHNGDDATPDVGDSIYDTPYGNDEFVEVYTMWLVDFPYNTGDRIVYESRDRVDEDTNPVVTTFVYEATAEVSAGILPTNESFWRRLELADAPVDYTKGRTNRRGWYQIFDGDNFEDYVIRILQGKVVEKIRCATIRAGRSTVAIGSLQRDQGAEETDNQFAARVCRSIPGNAAFHDGINRLPVAGDRIFVNDFTPETLSTGVYPIEGGSFIDVNSSGLISRVVPCVERVCLRDLVNTYGVLDDSGAKIPGLLDTQIKSSNTFTYNGRIDEDIFGNTDRQDAPQVTVRWSARGSERYPANPDDFYELTIDSSVDVGDTLTLTNDDFVRDSRNDNNLEYTILEFCYNRTLVPQFVDVTFYRGTTESLAGTSQTPTPVLPAGSYPNQDAAIALARIFDQTGNLGTGSVEVLDEIYYDNTAIIERYFVVDDLSTPLDGTNGVTDITMLDSVVIDGTTRRGLWWAFGPSDNMAADRSLLIDRRGVVLAERGRDFAFEVSLGYDIDDEIDACNVSGISFRDYHSDNDDFADATTIRNVDGSVAPAGYYVWEDNDDTTVTTDDFRVVRYWTGTAFDSTRLSTPLPLGRMAQNCPVTLPSVSVRYSTNQQTLVCGSAPIGTYYLSGGATLASLEANTGTIGIFTNPFGRTTSAVPAGFFSEGGVNYTWNGSVLSVNRVSCILTCTDPLATNTGSAGDCTYPTVCVNPAASNFVSNPNPLFNTSTTEPVCNLPAVRTLSIFVVNNINGPVNGYSIPAAAVSPTSGVAGTTFSFTGGTPTITDTALYRTVVNGAALSETISIAGATATGRSGTIGSANIVITLTYAGDIEEIPEVIVPAGCAVETAANYTPGSDGTVQCYFGPVSYAEGNSDTLVCDAFNTGSATTVNLYTDSTAGTQVGTQFYTLSGGTFSAYSGTGWLTRDGGIAIRIANGGVVQTGIGCPLIPRVENFRFTRLPSAVARNEEFAVAVSWTPVGPSGLRYDILIRGTNVADELETGAISSVRPLLQYTGRGGTTTRITAEIRNAGETTAIQTITSEPITTIEPVGGGLA